MRTCTLLLASTLLCSMATFTAAAQSTCNGPGKARWPIKTSLPDGADPSGSAKTVPLDKLLALAAAPDVSDNDKRYQSTRIPAFDNDLQLKEGDLVTTTGWLFLVATEKDDCDYHIQISPEARTTSDPPQESDDCLIVEAPRPDFLSGDSLSADVTQERDFIKEKILAGKEPSGSASVMQHPVCVTVTGQLFYDDAHESGQLRGKKKMSSHTLWELHPITAFKFAPVSACPKS
jgi:hypothetical protein